MLYDPITRLNDDELDRALDDVIERDDWTATWAICREIERRGDLVKV